MTDDDSAFLALGENRNMVAGSFCVVRSTLYEALKVAA
jgi:hypothetical protein